MIHKQNKPKTTSQEVFPVIKNNKMYFTDLDQAVTVPSHLESAYRFQEGLALIEINKWWGYINKDGTLVIDAKFADARNFSEGLACVKLNGKWGYIDKKGTIVIYPKFDDAGFFNQGLATIKLNGKTELINKKGVILTHALELRTVDHPEYWYG
ncbi:WG repeat-containing protein [candidate division CSSED10-310 bacterium]|uniref:WG repeat-containing protein n=1 Tax=candidate division CSSED10-310 bacterium TaxID=2855610 RepID=A0ABV6Z4Z9_UNCC1